MLPIEIISHFARVLSLTVRLYANMFAGDLVTLAFFSLIPIGIPLVFLALHFGVAIIQAYVFMILATTPTKACSEGLQVLYRQFVVIRQDYSSDHL